MVERSTETREWRIGRRHLLGIVAGSGIVSGAGASKIGTVRAEGSNERWSFQTDSDDFPTRAIVEETAYAVTEETVYALDATDGTERWQFQEEFPLWYDVGSERVFVTGRDADRLFALDLTGETQWVSDIELPDTEAVTVAGDTLFASGLEVETDDAGTQTYTTRVHAFDGGEGDERWQVEYEDRLVLPWAAIDGLLYSTGSDGRVYALDAQSVANDFRADRPFQDGDDEGADEGGDDGHSDGNDDQGRRTDEERASRHSRGDDDDGLPGFGIGGALLALAGVGYALKGRIEERRSP